MWRRLEKCPCPAACASQWRQPRLLAMTHIRWATGAKVGTRARTTHVVWPLVSVGCKPGQSTGARTRTRADLNVRPRPLAQRTGKEKEKEGERGRRERKEERKKESGGFSEITEPSAHRGLHRHARAWHGDVVRGGGTDHTLPQVSLGEQAFLQDKRTSIH